MRGWEDMVKGQGGRQVIDVGGESEEEEAAAKVARKEGSNELGVEGVMNVGVL